MGEQYSHIGAEGIKAPDVDLKWWDWVDHPRVDIIGITRDRDYVLAPMKKTRIAPGQISRVTHTRLMQYGSVFSSKQVSRRV